MSSYVGLPYYGQLTTDDNNDVDDDDDDDDDDDGDDVDVGLNVLRCRADILGTSCV